MDLRTFTTCTGVRFKAQGPTQPSNAQRVCRTINSRLVSNRLRVQENGHNRLLNLAVVYSRRLGLNDTRLR
jgi:hypothetical protein